MIDLVCVLVQQRALLRAGGELEHLLHHVHGELVPGVHRHDGPGKREVKILFPTRIYLFLVCLSLNQNTEESQDVYCERCEMKACEMHELGAQSLIVMKLAVCRLD